MQWRPRLLLEEASARITKFRIAKLDVVSMIFEIEYRITLDEMRRAAMGHDIATPEPPVVYGSADDLIEAIRADRYPAGVALDDVLYYARKVGLHHLVAPRTEDGHGGIERDQYNTILATIYHKVRERALANSPEHDAAAIKAAHKAAWAAQAAIARAKTFGGDWRASKGRPGSLKHRKDIVPILVDHFMKESHRPAIAVAKGLFNGLPNDWLAAIFGPQDNNVQYVDMQGAGHFTGKHAREFLTRRSAALASRVDVIRKKFEGALTGEKTEANWVALYSLVVIPLSGFRQKFEEEYNAASDAGNVVQVGMPEDPSYRWDTGIPTFADWVTKIDLLSDNNIMTAILRNIMGVNPSNPGGLVLAGGTITFNQGKGIPDEEPEPEPELEPELEPDSEPEADQPPEEEPADEEPPTVYDDDMPNEDIAKIASKLL